MINITKHKLILVQILKDIYTDNKLGALLGFKGGTSVYLFYNLPRFSVDLDFNLLKLQEKKFVLDSLKNKLSRYGHFRDISEKQNTLFFLLSYENNMQNIKVEISKRSFQESYQLKNYLGIPMLVMKKEDMFAHKLAALLDRKKIANRDIFDIWFFMKNNWTFNKAILESRVKIPYKDYIAKCIQNIEKIDNRYILQGLGELVDNDQKIWIKNHLKDEVLFLMRFYYENF